LDQKRFAQPAREMGGKNGRELFLSGGQRFSLQELVKRGLRTSGKKSISN